MNKTHRRWTAVLTLSALALLLAPPAAAASTEAPTRISLAELLDGLLVHLADLLGFAPPADLDSLHARGGAGMDPDGAPAASGPSPPDGPTITSEGGAGMDPNG